ncbi:hypothetical protein HMPREF9005_0862, partial [Actinomyces sp. oral taxon 178 str. F0338]
ASPPRAAATEADRAAAVRPSGSWSAHCWARSSSSIVPPSVVEPRQYGDGR